MVRSVLLGAFTLFFSVSVASALTVVKTYNVMSYTAPPSPNHSLFMNGDRYHFAPGAKFVVMEDGSGVRTGNLTGKATVDGVSTSAGFLVDLNFGPFRNWTEQTSAPVNSGAKNGGGGDPSTWTYMDLLPTSTLTGINGIAAAFDLLMKPLPYGGATFQYGLGANDKNGEFGLSGWFFTAGTDGKKGTGSPCKKGYGGSTCDFNLKLTSVPLPAGIALLPVGLAVLAGMRMRRRMAA